MCLLKDQILATKAEIVINPSKIVTIINTFTNFKEHNLSPLQRKHVRKT